MNVSKKMTKVLVVLTMVGLFSATGLAAWILSIETSVTGNVVSQSDIDVLNIVTDFQALGDINTTLTAQTVERNFSVYNSNGIINMTINIDNDIQDYGNDSCDNTGDITTTHKWNGVTVTDGQEVLMNSALNTYTVEYNVVRFGCPATIDLTVNLAQAGI